MIRKIIHINEEKCNGCGACANACHEGAMQIHLLFIGVRMTITYMKLFWNLSQMQTKCIRMNM